MPGLKFWLSFLKSSVTFGKLFNISELQLLINKRKIIIVPDFLELL